MNRLTAIGLASLVAYGLLIVSKYAGFVPLSGADASVRAPSQAATTADASAVVPASPEPRPAASFPAPQRVSLTRPSPAASEFRSVRDLKLFADGLSVRRASLTGDERFHLAKALEECQFVLNLSDDLAAYSARQRKQFVATLPPDDGGNAKRLAAYDAIDNTQRCLRFAGSKISPKDIEDLYNAAARQGDPRAQARMLVADLGNKNSGNKPQGESSTHTPEELSRIIGLLETRDPEAMLIVGGYLSQSATAANLRIGENGETPEPSAFLGAFSLVACDYGTDCSALQRETFNACAYAGYCSAQTFEELYQGFLASPWAYSQAIRYRVIIHNAIENRNWALLGLIPTVPKTKLASSK